MKLLLKLVSMVGVLHAVPVVADEWAMSERMYTYDPIAGVEEARKHPIYSSDDLEPARSDFSVVNQVFLSTKVGERLAVVTLKNDAAGTRSFRNNYIVAVFANGDKRLSDMSSFQVAGGETLTYSFEFGVHRHPILYVYTKN